MSNDKNEPLKTLRANLLQKVNQGKKRTHTFDVDFTEYDPAFMGKFMVHYPSQVESLQIGVNTSALLMGNDAVDIHTRNLATILATLDIVIDYRPDWFDIDDPAIEYEMLEAIFIEYADWRDSFRRGANQSRPEGDSQDPRSEIPVVGTENI